MASKSIPETIKKLDPTKLASSKFVLRPETRGKVIQGKHRNPNSRAAKRYRELESARLKKALKHVAHGKNIFVYNHLRTNQVVYSLTRALNFRNVLSQLIYHGKKTVPPKLRKDMWTPYFSLHFPSSAVGLKAYRILRELSVQRQLSPNPETITISDEFLNRIRPKDPNKAVEWDEEWTKRVGDIMDKKRRARVLMDQKATSVADVAATLQWQLKENERKAASEDEGEKEKNLSKKGMKRLRKVRGREKQKQEEIAKRLESLTKTMSKNGEKVAIDVPETAEEYDVQDGEVKILWADLEDARHANSWPEGVSHGDLERVPDHIIQGAKGMVGEVETEQVQPQPQPQSQSSKSTKGPKVKEQEPEEESSSWTKKLKFW